MKIRSEVLSLTVGVARSIRNDEQIRGGEGVAPPARGGGATVAQSEWDNDPTQVRDPAQEEEDLQSRWRIAVDLNNRRAFRGQKPT